MRSGFLSLCLFFCLSANAALGGLWYDRTRSGHGLDLHRSEAGSAPQLFGAFYTYAPSGEPEWYWLQVREIGESAMGDLQRITNSRGVQQVSAVGTFSIAPVSICPDAIARTGARRLLRFEFRIAATPQVWCLEPALPNSATPEAGSATPMAALTGAWYAPEDSGWGLLTHYYEASGVPQVFQTVYFYDADGAPRWAVGQGTAASFSRSIAMSTVTAPPGCVGCAVTTAPTAAGSVESTLRTNNGSANRARLDVRYGGSTFSKDAAVTLLSTPLSVPGVASTREGLIRGEGLAGTTVRYLNIPFAAPPTGSLRWRAPLAPLARNAVLDATVVGPGCPQVAGTGFFANGPATLSEDCLQLNVWTTTDTSIARPVMVWIHGGGLIQGSAVEAAAGSGRLSYDGAAYAADGIVFVSINYRLGPLGYLALRGAARESGSVGNYGLQDQLAALAWVQDNIRALGGDPDRVTIFGESAGGVSVCALLASVRANAVNERPLFQRAIIQSGNCSNNLSSSDVAFQQGDRLTQNANCASATNPLACMRALSSEQVLALAKPVLSITGGDGESYGLIADPMTLREPPGAALRGGRTPPVPVILGVNDDETTTLFPANTLPQTIAGYEALIRTRFPTIASQVLTRYPASAYRNAPAAYQDLLDDVTFTCPTRRAAADLASVYARLPVANRPQVYHYALTEIFPDAALAPLESFHGQDVVLLFGPRAAAAAAERRLSLAMQQTWRSFAKGETPTVAGTPWPTYTDFARVSWDFTSLGNRTANDYRGDYCRFWAQFGDF